MSKLSRKFLLNIFMVLLFIGGLSLYLNQNFIERYFLYQEKQEISRISDILLSNKDFLEPCIAELEASEDVVIVWMEPDENNSQLNTKLLEAFRSKGISLKKYWLWEQDQQDTMNHGRKLRVYSQEKLNYSLMVEYVLIDNAFVAIAKVIPNIDKTLALVNKVTVGIFIGAGILLFLLITVLVYKITAPIQKIGDTARAISNLNFTTIDLHTNDELETLAEDINRMSHKLQESHQLLNQKNQQMERLLANVSHDLKTPIALIKMYTCGMKDNLDDGTFIDTIMVQNNRMDHMVERLLSLAKIQQQEIDCQTINISTVLKELIREYSVGQDNQQIDFKCSLEDLVEIQINPEDIYLLLSNLISNGVKYSKDGVIVVKLSKEGGFCTFSIENRLDETTKLDMQKIWEPFYVAEQSRNQHMSGTGLGLSLVKAVSEKYKLAYDCQQKDETIMFQIIFPINK